MDHDQVTGIVGKHDEQHGNLIAILEEIQGRYGYLPEEALRLVAEQTGKPLVDVYGVATFYHSFSLKPRGKHLVSCCLGTACHVQGGPRIAEELQRQLEVAPGDMTADGEFTLETVNCLGACALGPVVLIDGHYFSQVRTSQVAGLLAAANAGLDRVDVETDERIFPVEVSCGRCNHSLMDSRRLIDGCPAIRVTAAFEDRHGWLALSSLYGSYKVSSEYEIPPGTVVQLFCPHCHGEMLGGGACGDCGAPMVPMIVRGGGTVQICSRRGCLGHILDLGGTTIP
ncbi:MAG: NAD(P)H-dependent oxidoreductase subunit E [Candidatus Krumholzibacteriia bacterium]